MKKQTVEHIIHTSLKDKISFGESKHRDKQEMNFGESTYKIYSYSTYNTYLKECKLYARWLKEEKNVSKTNDLSKTEQFAREYIEKRLNCDRVSVYTAKLERSALSMLYNKRIDVEMPTRDNKNITRSRLETKNDKYISRDGKYRDVFTMAIATGCRRRDLGKLTKDCLVEKDGHLYIKILGSKGGRDRITYVRGEYAQQVKEIVNNAKNNKLFVHIPKEIDVHGLRREYCKGLYDEIKDNKELRDNILKNYPPRREYKTQKDRDGNSITKEIKSDVYRDRGGNVYERDNIYVLSQCLGHNRLDVSVTHYLKS